MVIFAGDHLFYEGKNCDGIYDYFRAGAILHGRIQKPTGKRNEFINIQGNYNIIWVEIICLQIIKKRFLKIINRVIPTLNCFVAF